MNDATTNLDRLHDLVLPSPVAWWPPAPGWFVLIAILALVLLLVARRAWRSWHANAYRRAARSALAAARDHTAISEILRRTALAIAPRASIAALTGDAWATWLASQCDGPMPASVRAQLSRGIYAPTTNDANLAALRAYATHWIAHHRRSAPGNG